MKGYIYLTLKLNSLYITQVRNKNNHIYEYEFNYTSKLNQVINTCHDPSEPDCLMVSQSEDKQLVVLWEFLTHQKSASRMDHIGGIVLEPVLTPQRLKKHPHMANYHCRQSALASLCMSPLFSRSLSLPVPLLMCGLCMLFYRSRIGQSQLGAELLKLVCLRIVPLALSQIHPGQRFCLIFVWIWT